MQVAHIRTEGREKETAVSRQFAILSVSALVSTIILIMVGSIVRVTGNGLGCPDWPLCHGQAIPPFYLSAWVEFIHRLFGAAVVLQVGLLIFMSWRQYRSRPYIYLISKIAAVVLVIQVILGGIHVIYELPRWTGWIHTAIAMLIAGLVASWVALTNNSLRQLHQRAQQTLAHTRLIFWTTISAVATYILLLTGSLVTRTGASLVCPNFPYCGLSIIPDYLRPIVWIQMTHRYTAYIVAFTILMVLWQLLRHARQDIILRRFALTLTSLIVIQFSLGMANVLLALPMWSRVLHLGTGATIWVVMVLLTVTLRFENA